MDARAQRGEGCELQPHSIDGHDRITTSLFGVSIVLKAEDAKRRVINALITPPVQSLWTSGLRHSCDRRATPRTHLGAAP